MKKTSASENIHLEDKASSKSINKLLHINLHKCLLW
jgi:hypothetical protein